MIQWKQLIEWQTDWQHIHAQALESRQGFLRRAPSREQELFMQCLQEVKRSRRELIAAYAEPFANQLAPDSPIACTPHLDRLLELGERHRKQQLPDPRRWFEALSLFDQALALARIEHKDPLESVGHDMDVLLDYLWDEFFEGDYRRMTLHTYYDPQADYVVWSHNVSMDTELDRPSLMHRPYPLVCRQIKGGGIGFMEERIKNAFSIWLKIGRKMHAGERKNAYMVTDRCGLAFVVPTEKDLRAFASILRKTLLANGARVLERFTLSNNGKPMDPSNKHSSPLFRAGKMLIKWKDREYEFQFLTFHDYLTSKYSLTDANHELYKQKQAFNFALPFLWPKDLYGIDWEDPVVRDELRRWKIDQLGWHVNGKFSNNH